MASNKKSVDDLKNLAKSAITDLKQLELVNGILDYLNPAAAAAHAPAPVPSAPANNNARIPRNISNKNAAAPLAPNALPREPSAASNEAVASNNEATAVSTVNGSNTVNGTNATNVTNEANNSSANSKERPAGPLPIGAPRPAPNAAKGPRPAIGGRRSKKSHAKKSRTKKSRKSQK